RRGARRRGQGPPLHGRRDRRRRARRAVARPGSRPAPGRARGLATRSRPGLGTAAARGRGRPRRDGARPARESGSAGGLPPARPASPARVAAPPRRAAEVARRAGQALVSSFSPTTPARVLNEPLSPYRRLATAIRPLDDLKSVKRTFGTTLNDVVLAVSTGAL